MCDFLKNNLLSHLNLYLYSPSLIIIFTTVPLVYIILVLRFSLRSFCKLILYKTKFQSRRESLHAIVTESVLP
jgi:hypothetical protein